MSTTGDVVTEGAGGDGNYVIAGRDGVDLLKQWLRIPLTSTPRGAPQL